MSGCLLHAFFPLLLQLRLYAKYADVSHVVLDDTVRTYAVCEMELNKDYYILKGSNKREVVSFILITALAPVISIALMAIIVRSESRNIQRRIRDSANHPNVAGIVLTGMYVTIYIITLDFAACYYAIFGYHELNNIHTLNRLNIASTAILLILDILSCVPGVIVFVYICSSHCYHKTPANITVQPQPAAPQHHRIDDQPVEPLNKCNKCIIKWCLNYFFVVILGTSTSQVELRTTENVDSHKSRLVWIMTLSYVTPLFAVSSHATFILVSWLTDTVKASSVALTSTVVLLYLFLVFRQCYKMNSDVKPSSHWVSRCLPFYSIVQCYEFFCAPCSSNQNVRRADQQLEGTVDMGHIAAAPLVPPQPAALPQEEKDRKAKGVFNTKALCIVCSWSWVFPLMATLMIFAFAELPIVTFDVLSNLLTTFQVFIVILSLLITYKIFNVDDSNNLNRFFRKLRDTYPYGSPEQKQDINPLDAAGYIVGQLAEVVIHKLPQKQRRTSI